MRVKRKQFKDELKTLIGCDIQHDGWTCGTCFHELHDELELKEDIHEYWLAVLKFRGDYDNHEPILPDRLDLIEEFYEQIKSRNFELKGFREAMKKSGEEYDKKYKEDRERVDLSLSDNENVDEDFTPEQLIKMSEEVI